MSLKFPMAGVKELVKTCGARFWSRLRRAAKRRLSSEAQLIFLLFQSRSLFSFSQRCKPEKLAGFVDQWRPRAWRQSRRWNRGTAGLLETGIIL